jgi:hypothetical protein
MNRGWGGLYTKCIPEATIPRNTAECHVAVTPVAFQPALIIFADNTSFLAVI